ncbi:MAG: hypothetical protein KBT48_05250 [Firmicutes bacterium]|nr:hypothetical protein [Bacillota bacterium]
MNKITKIIACTGLAFSMAACSNAAPKEEEKPQEGAPITGNYSYFVEGFDYGCSVTKATVTLSEAIPSISADRLSVSETKKTTDWTDENFAEKELTFDRTVTNAYLIDDEGKETTEPSNKFVIEMSEDPNTGSPFTFSVFTGRNSWCNPYQLTIAMDECEIDPVAVAKSTSADNFTIDQGEFAGVTYDYAYYAPEKESDTVVVWLHGGGEGGVGAADENINVYTALLGNKVTALAGEKFQEAVGGAHVLVPQCPTYWIDVDGKNGGEWEHADGTSFYTESLVELIDSYVAKVGAKNVVITGCSNGGYMTMVLAKNCGDKYTSYVPICAPMDSEAISEDDLNVLKELPMYFIYSEDDDTVDPKGYEIPVLKRLEEAGAKNISVSTSEHVTDLSGKYKDAEGKPYQYSGHWSWIYFDNNDTADQNGVSVFDWIKSTLK